MKPLPLFGAVPPGLAAVVKFDIRQAPQWALCRDRARHVGEIVAMVVADSPERAEDAVELIQVEWEPLPPVVDMTRAAEPGAPLLHPEWGSNIGIGFTHSIGDADGAFARADVTVSRDLPHPALRRHAAREPRRGRGVGPARRDDDHLELDAGLALRPAGAHRRARCAAAQDPCHRPRPGRRLRHEGLGIRRRTR